MYQTQITIHSVISISFTQKIFDIKLVRRRCRDIANNFLLKFIQLKQKCGTFSFIFSACISIKPFSSFSVSENNTPPTMKTMITILQLIVFKNTITKYHIPCMGLSSLVSSLTFLWSAPKWSGILLTISYK